MIDIFSELKFESSEEKIIRQLRTLIITGKLSPGDKLPPERKLSKKFGVGRSIVRDAIRKLEFYGIVKTQPQSGTMVRGMGLVALEGLITDVLNIEESDFASLIDTRILLEIESAGIAATKRTGKDIFLIQNAYNSHEEKITRGDSAQVEDFLFHLEIAEVSGNNVLKSLMRIITPDIIKSFTESYAFREKENRPRAILVEHKEILDHIIAQNAEGAKKAMRNHLEGV